MPELAKYYALLTLCARAQAHLAHLDPLRKAAEALNSWESLPYLAEVNGLSPLVSTHLRAAEIIIPESARLALQARAMQRSHANRVRTRALVDILAAFEAEGIDLLVLKGMATALLVYSQPGLRPMSDIDLLVSKTDAQRGQILLAELGFQASIPGMFESVFEHRHMPLVQRQDEGMQLYVELHHTLGFDQMPATDFEDLRPAAIPLAVDGPPAFTLDYTDLLEHTYYHMFETPLTTFRLIWIADMVSLVERFGEQIDWERLPPRVFNALAAINRLTPFDGLPQVEDGRSSVPLSPFERAAYLRGWPFSVMPSPDKDGNVFKAFRPSAWWLRLYFGLSSDRSLFGVRVWHRVYLLWWLADYHGLSHITRRLKDYSRGAIARYGSKRQSCA